MEFQKRVKEEFKELREKSEKLQNFLGSEQFSNLEMDEQGALLAQNSIMDAYLVILSLRIAKF